MRADSGVEQERAIRPSELLLALSRAADLAEGREAGHARRVAALALQIAKTAGLDEAEHGSLIEAALLHDLGLTAVVGKLAAALPYTDEEVVTRLHADPEALISRIGGSALQAAEAGLSQHPREGAALVEVAPLPPVVARLVLLHHERWDGSGYPERLAGPEIPKAARILALADLVESAAGPMGTPAEQAERALRRLDQEAGRSLDPDMVAEVRSELARDELWRSLDPPPEQELFDELDDQPLDSSEHPATLFVDLFGTLVDSKCAFTRRHSTNVARLVGAAAPDLGLDSRSVRVVTRAARIHDLGQIAVHSRVLEKAGSLAPGELKQIRKHPSVTAQILDPLAALREVVRCAEAHHERLDGSGYPRGVPAEEIPTEVRLLAAADAYEALTAERPFRGPLSRDSTLNLLRSRAGRQYDGESIEAVGDVTADKNLLDGQGH